MLHHFKLSKCSTENRYVITTLFYAYHVDTECLLGTFTMLYQLFIISQQIVSLILSKIDQKQLRFLLYSCKLPIIEDFCAGAFASSFSQFKRWLEKWTKQYKSLSKNGMILVRSQVCQKYQHLKGPRCPSSVYQAKLCAKVIISLNFLWFVMDGLVVAGPAKGYL